MIPCPRNPFLVLVVLFAAAIISTGCVSESKAKLREKNAFLAGQNTVLMQQQAQSANQTAAQSPGVTVVGAVQHPQVPWVTGMTLGQAIATANYVGPNEPRQIIITRNGESATLDASALAASANVPLEIGDVIELR